MLGNISNSIANSNASIWVFKFEREDLLGRTYDLTIEIAKEAVSSEDQASAIARKIKNDIYAPVFSAISAKAKDSSLTPDRVELCSYRNQTEVSIKRPDSESLQQFQSKQFLDEITVQQDIPLLPQQTPRFQQRIRTVHDAVCSVFTFPDRAKTPLPTQPLEKALEELSDSDESSGSEDSNWVITDSEEDSEQETPSRSRSPSPARGGKAPLESSKPLFKSAPTVFPPKPPTVSSLPSPPTHVSSPSLLTIAAAASPSPTVAPPSSPTPVVKKPRGRPLYTEAPTTQAVANHLGRSWREFSDQPDTGPLKTGFQTLLGDFNSQDEKAVEMRERIEAWMKQIILYWENHRFYLEELQICSPPTFSSVIMKFLLNEFSGIKAYQSSYLVNHILESLDSK